MIVTLKAEKVYTLRTANGQELEGYKQVSSWESFAKLEGPEGTVIVYMPDQLGIKSQVFQAMFGEHVGTQDVTIICASPDVVATLNGCPRHE